MDRFEIEKEVTIREAKLIFSQLMCAIQQKDKAQFLSYIGREWQTQEFSSASSNSSPDREKCDRRREVPPVIRMIICDIKERVPFEAVLPSERIEAPKRGENSDCDSIATVHVDGFLYDDEEIEVLIDIGKLQNNYCADCGGKNIKPCVIISHSASYRTMEYVCHILLPPLDGKTVLDIGSRLGAVLYSAYVLTTAERIVGVEMNADLCKLQNDIIRKYNMGNRIQVVNQRIENCPRIVRTSDVIVINNAFEFYVPEDVHIEIWQFLKANIRRGTILVTCPQIEHTFKTLDTGIVIHEWVKPYAQEGQDAATNLITESLDFPDIGIYEVL